MQASGKEVHEVHEVQEGPLRLMMVGHHHLTRRAVGVLLESVGGFEVVAEAESEEEALSKAREHRPGIVVTGIDLPGLDPVVLAERLAEDPNTVARVVVLSANLTPEFMLRAMTSSISAFIAPTCELDALASGLRCVESGFTVLSEAAREILCGLCAQSSQAADRMAGFGLTDRESAVLSVMKGGLTNKEIAAQLRIGVRTVEMHVAHIIAKLGVHSRTEAVVRALQADRSDQPGAA